MTRPPHRRPAFTLVELIVVVSIIAVLASLSAGAILRLRNSQTKSNTIATVTAVNTALDARWNAIVTKSKEEINKQSTPAAKAAIADAKAGGNPDAALTLLLYAKMKNQLPMSFAEAKSTTQVGSIVLQPLTPFTSAITGSGPGSPEESGVCLFIALTSSGGDGAVAEGLEQRAITTRINNVEYRTFGDAWGTPLAFVRHCYVSEVQSSPFVKTAPFDPFDPSPGHVAAPLLTGSNASRWNQIVANVPSFAGMPGSYNQGQNFVPTVISAGPNGTNKAAGFNPFFDPTIFDPTSDNIYGFRLRREGTQGN